MVLFRICYEIFKKMQKFEHFNFKFNRKKIVSF